MKIMYIIGLIIFISLIYEIFLKEVKTFNRVILNGLYLRLLGLKQKEIRLYLKSLDVIPMNEKEKRDLLYTIGIWYVKKRQYETATHYLDRAFQNYNENFAYKKEFELVIKAYEESGQIEKSKQILRFFLIRKSFDKRFHRLEIKYHYLLE
jgi:tetratricopeptide (TPR) repeat protein